MSRIESTSQSYGNRPPAGTVFPIPFSEEKLTVCALSEAFPSHSHMEMWSVLTCVIAGAALLDGYGHIDWAPLVLQWSPMRETILQSEELA